MMGLELANTATEIERLTRSTPAASSVLPDGTRAMCRYRDGAWEAHVPALDQHVIAAHLDGPSEGFAKIGGKTYVSERMQGTITLAPRGRDSWRRRTGISVVSSVTLAEERLQSCMNEVAGGGRVELVDRVGYDDPKLFSIIELLTDEVVSGHPNARLFMEHLIELLCLQLMRAHSSLAPDVLTPRHRGLANWQVKRVVAYMRDNLARDVSLQELADLLDLSRFHFCTAFRLATGYRPYEWFARIRIETAKKALADPTLRIGDVALVVGYRSPSAFSAAFRRIVGCTPAEFRRKL